METLPLKKEKESVGLIGTDKPVLDWTMDNVCEWMFQVRKKGGIPMFKTKFGGVRFKKDGEYCIQGVGWGVKGMGVYFCGVPEELVKTFEEKPADFLRVYHMCPPEYKEKIEKTIPPL